VQQICSWHILRKSLCTCFLFSEMLIRWRGGGTGVTTTSAYVLPSYIRISMTARTNDVNMSAIPYAGESAKKQLLKDTYNI
jgi:hypothetical protein